MGKGRKRTPFTIREGIEGKDCTGILCKEKEDPWKPLTEFRYSQTQKTLKNCCKQCATKYNQQLKDSKPFKRVADKIMERKNKVVDRSIDWEKEIKELYRIQDGKCAATGLILTLQQNDPFVLSADRIDNNQGYIKNNVRLTCWWVNRSRGKRNVEDFDREIQGILEEVKKQWIQEFKDNEVKGTCSCKLTDDKAERVDS
ncbi:hypothetical protein ACQKMI_24465 [Lysinibacillus sp. NPDC097214]|uniref:hypothetical protein n=1 Tax=Lysinibacillus sp. NPDC097214 TaxID=3390584 RepID=UPI003D02A894